MSELNYTFDVNSPSRQGLILDFLTEQPISAPGGVRNDSTSAFSLRPVRHAKSGPLPWLDDHAAGDTYIVAIGNSDAPPSGGTFTITIGTQPIAAQVFNVSATDLQTALSAASVAGGNPALTVTLLVAGSYRVSGNTFGAVPLMTGASANLFPACTISVLMVSAGDSTSNGVQIISISQQNVAIAYPSTALPSAAVSAADIQAASATRNLISKITFSAEGTYGGTYEIAILAAGLSFVVGGVSPLLTAAQLGANLSLHPSIYYAETDGTADNVSVTATDTGYLVEFIGSLSGAALTTNIVSNTTASPTVITTSAAHRIANGATVSIPTNNGSFGDISGSRVATVITATTFSIPVDCLGSRSIVTNTAANPTEITTDVAHGFTSGDVANIPTNNGSNATIAGNHVISVTSTMTFTIPIDCTAAGGTGGTVIDTAFKGGTGGTVIAPAPTLTVANVSLVAPVGVKGYISLNTINLVEQFLGTDAETLDFFFTVKRTRSTGEIKTTLKSPVTLSRDIINIATAVVLPSFIGVNFRVKPDGEFQWGPSAGDGLYTTPMLYGSSGAYYLDFSAGAA